MRISLSFILIFLNYSISVAQNNSTFVYFDFNKSEITKKAAETLESFMVSNSFAIKLSGHTDSKGSINYNYALSQRRLNAVKQFLINNGFPEKWIQQEEAFGKTKLILENDADEVKGEINRRVEIAVIVNKITNVDTSIIIQKEKTIKDIIEDASTKKGAKILLKQMQFEGGRHKILQSSVPQLNDLLNALKVNSKLKILLEGHICCLPDNSDGFDLDTQTDDLSKQRAKAIKDYLINAGIEGERIQYRGFGHAAPIYAYPEKNENERVVNRRVEIKILDK
jgi:outer membrane protein OmpA-like peptidoglycan-associated protein